MVHEDNLPTGQVANNGPLNVLIDNVPVMFDVPFVYGEPFSLATSFFIRAFPDIRFYGQSSNPFFLSYNSLYIQHIDMDFSNTARLIAIVNEAHPDAVVTGLGFDYSALVTGELPQPVPLPGALWLFAGAACWLQGRRVRSNARLAGAGV